MARLADYLVTDDLTILLALIAATVFLVHNFYKPQPSVHPILLGRQSDVARVRNPGESAVYRNYGTGLMGRFPLRPSKDVHILADLVRPDLDAPRTLWNTKITNSALHDRVAAFGTGLLRLAGLEAQESNVLLLLNDSLEFVICDLALASHSIPSLTLTSPTFIATALETHPPSAIVTHAEILPQLLELIYDEGDMRNHTVIVMGEPSSQVMATVSSKVKVLRWSDVEREGNRVEKIISPLPKPKDVFTVSLFALESGHLQGVQLTHENITAGVAATRGLLPLSQGLSTLDTIISAFSLSTAYGRAIAYTALFEGTSFATLDSTKLYKVDDTPVPLTLKYNVPDVLSIKQYPIPSPTVIFIRPDHMDELLGAIMKEVDKSFIMSSFAWRHKVAGLNEGYITKDSLWDRLVFDAARAKVIGDAAGTLRAVIVSGGAIPAGLLTPARVAFSTPFVNAFSHAAVAGPILASNPLDLQDFYDVTANISEMPPAPTGPPSINVEVKFVGVNDEAIENGADPEGTLVVRGPSVGKLIGAEDYVDVPRGQGEEDENWLNTGVHGVVHTNGTFRLQQPFLKLSTTEH